MTGFAGKRVLITGVCGTVGSELLRQLLHERSDAPAAVVGVDHNENRLFFLDQAYIAEPRAEFYVVDVRDRDELERCLPGTDIVFHAAAIKHVVLAERSPDQAVHSNIVGLQNVIAAATKAGAERVIFTSSDKAVNPTNVMGTSKLMGERLMTAATAKTGRQGPICASTRFGNVLGSSGSVIPVFHNQIAQGGPVTVTDEAMTRFVMSVRDAVRLVLDSAQLAQGGEVFITKMPVVAIRDLAAVMIRLLARQYGYRPEDIAISVIGTKPGEKLYEELMTDEETRRALELPDYFVVLPAFRGIYGDIAYDYPGVLANGLERPYVSSALPVADGPAIEAILEANDLLEPPAESQVHRYWPGDKKGTP